MFGRSKLAMKRRGVFERQLGDDLLARALVGRRRQRDARHVRKPLGENLELAVFGPEVVTPLRDAVRLVDREQRQCRCVRKAPSVRSCTQALGRDIEKIEAARRELPLDLILRAAILRRIQKRGLDAEIASARRPDPASAR